MTIKKIKWEDGLRLDSNILSECDNLNSRYSEFCNFLPFNLSKGFVSFDLDMDGLSSGLILIKGLEIYLDEKKLLYFDNSYPLSLDVTDSEIAAPISLYLNVNKEFVEEKYLKYTREILSLSREFDFSAISSTKIASFRLNNTMLEPLEYEFPILTMKHYLMEEVSLKLNKLISELESYNKFVFSASNPYAAIYLKHLIKKMKRNLTFSDFNKKNVSPFYIFNVIHDIYSYIIENNSFHNDQNDFIQYNINQAYGAFNRLIDCIEEVCQKRDIKNFVQLKLNGQKYICDAFPQEFFTANKYYLVIKEKNVSQSDHINFERYIRITSISRYTNTVILSLSGIKLIPINSKVHKNFHISLASTDFLFEIEQNTEWDFILVDKTATFSAFEGSENYEYFIAFI